MKVKLYKFPKGSHFLFNGVEFVRHEFITSVNSYKCCAVNRNLIVYLDPKTNVNLIELTENDSSC